MINICMKYDYNNAIKTYSHLRSHMASVVHKVFCVAVAFAAASAVHAQDNVLNLYSARHYQTEEVLYENFPKQTGIKINRTEADDNPLLERIKSEGKNSPADVILLVYA